MTVFVFRPRLTRSTALAEELLCHLGLGDSILLAITGCSCNVRAIKPMGNPETDGSRSGMAPCFQTTHWTVVLLAGQEDSPEAASALENLCRTYWYPLYAYARRQGHSPPDGQDLTQQFFAVFLEKKYFGLANPDRGRFRCFLLASISCTKA